VHHYRADFDKTCLNYKWVQACLQTGHTLLEAEDWGGFRVFHTSECIYSDEEDDEDLDDAEIGAR
jgi:hypothetical protein